MEACILSAASGAYFSLSAVLKVVFLSATWHHLFPMSCSGSHMATLALLYNHAAWQWCPLHSIYAAYASMLLWSPYNSKIIHHNSHSFTPHSASLKRKMCKVLNITHWWTTHSINWLHLEWSKYLTPCSRVLHKKVIGSQLVKKFPTIYGTWRSIATFTTARHHLSLSWARSIQSMHTTTPPPKSHFLRSKYH